MAVKENQSKRVIATSSMRATRQSRRLIILFIIGTMILSAGVVFKVWPIARIVVKPSIQTLSGKIEIKVDLDIAGPSPATLTIPGRVMTIGEDSNQLSTQNYDARTIGGTSIVFSDVDFREIARQALLKSVSPEAVLLSQTITVNEEEWSAAASGRLFYGHLTVSVKFYNQLPLRNWAQEIAGTEKNEAESILSSKIGVDKVEINFYPRFLANISQKLPKSQDDIRFTLDVD